MANENENGIQGEFNASAGKIISETEFLSKLKAIYKAELSFKEKVLMNTVERPKSFIGAVMTAIKMQRDFELNLEFTMAANDGSSGHYQSQTGERYMNTGILPLEQREDMRHTMTPKLTEKSWRLGEKAAKQCQDYTALRDAGHLKFI